MPRTVRPRRTSPSIVPKELLAREIARVLRTNSLTQTEASFICRESPSQLSLINTGKLRGFSVDRLVRILAALGSDVEIRTRPATGRTGRVRLSSR